MTNPQQLLARIQEVQRQALPARLLAGAQVLGRLWREGTRCVSGWAKICPCAERANDFCKAKLKWIGILLDYHGGTPYGLSGFEPFYVIEAMTVRQFAASGLTALVEALGSKEPIRFGKNGTIWSTLVQLGKANDSEAVDAVVKVQKYF